MLKKILQFKLLILFILIFTIIVTQLCTAYFFGITAETQFNHQFKQISKLPFIKIKSYNYYKGFFSSDMVSEVSVDSNSINAFTKLIPNLIESQNNHSIKYITHINHGIFSGLLNGYFKPTIAVAITNIQYSDHIAEVLKKFFNKNPPLTITNILYLNKSGTIKITSPKFLYEETLSGVIIDWRGLFLNVKYDKAFSVFETMLQVPYFHLIAPTKYTILLDNFHYKSNSKYSINNIKIGTTAITLNNVAIDIMDQLNVNLKLGNTFSHLTGINSNDFFDQLDIIDPNHFTLNNLKFFTNSKEQDNYFYANTHIFFESLVNNKKIYGPFIMDLDIDHILAPEFSGMLNEINILTTKDYRNDKFKQQDILNILKKYFAPILVNNPIIKLNTLSLKTPNGIIDINGMITTNNFLLSDINNKQEFIKKLQANIKFKIPKDVLLYLLMMQMKYFLSIGNANMDKQSADALKNVVSILLDNQLKKWKKLGYVKDNNSIISSNLKYNNAKLTLSIESQ